MAGLSHFYRTYITYTYIYDNVNKLSIFKMISFWELFQGSGFTGMIYGMNSKFKLF